MNKRIIGILAAAIIVSVLVVSIVFLELNQRPIASKVTSTWSPAQATVTTGNSVTVNCTLFNTDYHSEVTVDLSLQLVSVNGESKLDDIIGSNRIFRASFVDSIIPLEPQEQKVATVTIVLAADAQTGNYVFTLQGFSEKLNLIVYR
jgi:hypothetical protein